MSNVDARREVLLLPGELYIGEAGTRVHTLLGSCVAVTLWERTQRIGGICHYLLPGSRPLITENRRGHYGDAALGWLLNQMSQRGIPVRSLEAKIVGGGVLLESMGQANGIGAQNIALARRLLRAAEVAVVAEDVGRVGYRRLVFDITDGAVWIRHGNADIPTGAG